MALRQLRKFPREIDASLNPRLWQQVGGNSNSNNNSNNNSNSNSNSNSNNSSEGGIVVDRSRADFGSNNCNSHSNSNCNGNINCNSHSHISDHDKGSTIPAIANRGLLMEHAKR